MGHFRLDRTAFKAQNAEEASASHARHYKKLSWKERLKVAAYLNSIAFNFPLESPQKLDRTKFMPRARNE